MKSEDRGVKLKPAMERVVTAAELSEHTSQDDCWFVVDGKVYDVTNWLAQHPGGGAVILAAGRVREEEAPEDGEEGHGALLAEEDRLERVDQLIDVDGVAHNVDHGDRKQAS